MEMLADWFLEQVGHAYWLVRASGTC